MKLRNNAQIFVGITVIACSLVLLAALTFALSGFSWNSGGREVTIEFPDATGIKLHSVVRYAGKEAGAVTDIRYLTVEERQRDPRNPSAVRVKVKLHDDVPQLSEGVKARLDAETLLGEKFIALIPGAPNAAPLSDGAILRGSEVASIDAVARSAQEAIANVNQILVRLNDDYPALVPKVAELISRGNGILGQGSNLVNHADVTILNANGAVTQLRADYEALVPQLNALFSHAQGIATNAESAMEKVNSLVERMDGVVETNEVELSRIFGELRVVSQNLKVITTYTKGLSARLAERPSALIWSRKKDAIPSEEDILRSTEPVPLETKQD